MAGYTQKQVNQLAAELSVDPLGRAYAGMTDQQQVDDLNTANRTSARASLSGGEILEAIDGTEFAALSAADTARVDRIIGVGAEVIVGPGNAHNAVQELIATFGGGSATLTALAAMRDLQISRAAELGWPPATLGAIARVP